MTYILLDAEERFWGRVDVRLPDDCWEWTGCRNERGYGVLQAGGKKYIASRFVMLLQGAVLSPGAFVCHHCDNPPCVNPAHLYVGDALTNVLDRQARNRDRPVRGERHYRAKLAESDVRQIRREWTGAAGQQDELARRYSVSRVTINHIIRRKSWKHL